MKQKLLLIVMLFIAASAIQAQNPVLNLSNYLRNGMLDKAHENLNIAMQDVKYTSDAKTWLLRGNLYYATFRCYDYVNGVEIGMADSTLRYLKLDPLTDFKKQKTPEGRANKWEYDYGFTVLILNGKVHSFTDPANGAYKQIASSAAEALRLAKESYQKVIELDPRFQGDMTFPLNAYQGLSIISDGYTNLGVVAFNDGDFSKAYTNFSAAHHMKTERGIRDAKDTIPGYYAVVSARVYIRQLSEEGKYEEALAIAKEAMAIRPDDVDLALSEADTYLKMKNFIKTKELLEAVIKKQPDNANLYYVIGNIYDQLAKDTSNTAEETEENFKLSVSYYVQAIEKRADYFEALFNLGTVFNNRAVDRFAVAQKLPYGDPRADALFAEVDELFRTALPYLEKAHAVNPNDGDPIRMLYSIYLRLRMKENSDAMKIKVDALKK